MPDFVYLASQSPRRRQLLEQIGVRHELLLPDAEEDAEALEQARQTAQGILVRCLAEPSQFAHLPRTLSDCPSGKVGGSLGQLGPGDVVGEIERALGGLQAGDIFPRPVASRFGFIGGLVDDAVVDVFMETK